MNIMMSPIPFVLGGILLASAVMAGCLGDEWPLEECTKTGDMNVETVSPPGYAWDTDPLVVEVGEEVTFKVDAGDCPVVDYEWVHRDHRASHEYRGGNVTGSNIAGGFGSESRVTKNDTMTFRFDYVGNPGVGTILRDEEGRDMAFGYGPRTPEVLVIYQTSELLPTDGSTWSTEFPSICCPIESEARISIEEPGVRGQDWLQRFVVERTGEVLWEGRPNSYLYSDVFEQLGYDWYEVIRMELEPQAVFHEGLHQYSVDFRIGPIECSSNGEIICWDSQSRW